MLPVQFIVPRNNPSNVKVKFCFFLAPVWPFCSIFVQRVNNFSPILGQICISKCHFRFWHFVNLDRWSSRRQADILIRALEWCHFSAKKASMGWIINTFWPSLTVLNRKPKSLLTVSRSQACFSTRCQEVKVRFCSNVQKVEIKKKNEKLHKPIKDLFPDHQDLICQYQNYFKNVSI